MWKDYSVGFIKNNRASSVSIMVAAFISTLFLSFICSLFYNFWQYEIERIVLEEGDWQGRIIGELYDADLKTINHFPNVERAVINDAHSGAQGTVVDVYFINERTIFQDLPLIRQQLGRDETTIDYHHLLLSRYMIHDPEDEQPPMLMAFYLLVLLIVSGSLILIIRNSFAVSMNARIHQFGIFSSIGATPQQIRTCLMQEAMALCLLPILSGSIIGIALSAGVLEAANGIAADIAGRHDAVWRYHPLVFGITMLAVVLTVLLSAWIPARKLSKLTPLESIRSTPVFQLKKKSRSILALFFGVEGELASGALKTQKKALRTSSLSLTLSFLGYTMMLCFFTLSGISTNHTYFDKYKDTWDIMLTVKDTAMESLDISEELKELPGIEGSVIYQKAKSVVRMPDSWQSEEVMSLGGLESLAPSVVTAEEGDFLVNAPIVILDDAGFREYCERIGITPQLDGTIILNRIWDSVNSNFRYKSYVPYMKEDQTVISLQNPEQEGTMTAVSVIAYTNEAPVLREEYDNYALVQVISQSAWTESAWKAGKVGADSYIRVLAEADMTAAELKELETAILQLMDGEYEVESENRIQEQMTNDEMMDGAMLIMGGFCFLLALIGIANVFSNALGFVYQRKREIAQYMSVGVTPAGIRKIFCIEALVIAGRPLLITLPLTVVFVYAAVTASYLDPMEFIVQMPIWQIMLFSFLIFFFVGLAYYIGGRKIFRGSLSEALADVR